MNHAINISVLNNKVGIPVSSDGVMGIVVKAIAVSTTFALGTPYLLSKLSDLEALGVTASYDATNNLAVHQQVSDFYAQAGEGALLWVYGIATSTTFASFVASAAYPAFVRGTANPTPANLVKMVGFAYDVPTATQSATDFPADVTASIPLINTANTTLFNQGYQISSILDGYKMKSTATATSLATLATLTAPSVSLCNTGTKPNGVSGVGAALGRFARITIGHGFGEVADGPLANIEAYLTNCISVTSAGTLIVGRVYTVYGGTSVTYNSVVYPVGSTFTAVTGFTTFTTPDTAVCVENMVTVQSLSNYADGTGDIGQLGTKQYMFMRTWINHSGFYWNDGATCCNPTFQLSTQEYNRVANHLSAAALSFFTDEMGKNLPIDTKTGAVDQSYLNVKQQDFYNLYILPLTVAAGSGDISDAALVVTGVNFNSTKTLNFTLSIVPTPILGNVNGTIQFTATI